MYFQTSIGPIHAKESGPSAGIPVLFLHGVFLDHSFWNNQTDALSKENYYCISLDMPKHGQSRDNIKTPWTIGDCADMLLEIVNQLPTKKAHLVGHSWGSMTAILAISKKSSSFLSATLFNVPLGKPTLGSQLAFRFQMTLSFLPHFYGTQAAKSLYTSQYIKRNSSVPNVMGQRLAAMPKGAISETITSVILNAENIEPKLDEIRGKLPVKVLFGDSDYARKQIHGEHVVIDGSGHMLPEELPQESLNYIRHSINVSQ